MKNHIILLALGLLPTALMAQQEITASQGERPFSKGKHESFQIKIPQTHVEQTEKDWTRYLKTTKGKTDKVNGEVIATNASVKNISTSPFSIYSKLVETPDGVVLTAWFAENDSQYISKDSIHRDWAVEKFLRDFAVDEYKNAVKVELENNNDKLKKLQKDLADLTKEQEKSVKSVNSDTRDIDKDNNSITNNDKEQASKQEQIDKQKGIVETLKSTPGQTLEDSKKTLKGFQSELKKLQGEKDKLNKDIEKLQANIKKEQQVQEKNLTSQKAKNDEIAAQQEVIKTVQAKLDGIK